MNKILNLVLKAKLTFVYLSFLTTTLISGLSYAVEWEQITLRSENQKAAGLKGGEGFQMIQSIAYAPTNPEIVYLVVDTSQVWKSTDGGKTWAMKHKGFYANGGLSVGVDPLNENIVFVAGAIGYPIQRHQPTDPLCGIFKTTDGGENWKLVRKNLYFKRDDGDNGGTYFAFLTSADDKRQTKTIFAATYEDGLLKSSDGGDSWIVCGLNNINIYDIKADTKNSAVIYIAATQGLYRYDDNTGQVSKIGTGLPDYPRTIAVNPQNPKIIYAAAGKYGVYRSDDGGMNFSKRNDGLPSGIEYTHISLSPVNPDYLYVSVNKSNLLNPFYSHDAGITWYAPETIDKGGLSLMGEKRFYSGQVVPHPKDVNIALTSPNGRARVIKTTDGGKTWFHSSEGLTGARMAAGKTALAFGDSPKKMIFFLTDHGPFLTENGGDTFESLNVQKNSNMSTTPVGTMGRGDTAKTIVTAVGNWGRQFLEISRNNGKSWKVINGTEDGYRFIAFHPQNPSVIYAQGFISEDAGTSWKRLSKNVYSVYDGNGDIVYTVDDVEKNKAVIRRSTDRGKTWKIAYPPLPLKAKAIKEIGVDPTNPDRVYVASNLGFVFYDPKGKKWVRKGEESGLTKDYFGLMSFSSVAVDPRHPEIIYLGKYAPGKGQSNGIFRSQDYGMNWENITGNLEEPFTIWSISVSPYDGTVYIGSTHGVWRLPPPYQK